MKVIQLLFQVISIFVSAIAGNWIGGQIRSERTGRPVNTLITEFEVGERRYRNFPAILRFYPAVLFSSIAKPRWFWALAGGILAGLLVDERYEKILMSQLFARLEDRA